MQLLEITPTTEDLEQLVHTTLSLHAGLPRACIATQPNRDKYHNRDNPSERNESLTEVFRLMQDLNRGALADPSLGGDKNGEMTFIQSLDGIVDDIVARTDERGLIYVELGPEPTKTARIIERMRTNGVKIHGYVGVDINPSSTDTMHDALSKLLPPEAIHFRIKDFAHLTTEDLRIADAPIFTTMLGFQEGNEHPARISALLRRILRPDDFVLSEMQVADRPDDDAFQAFYHHPMMRRFSRICLERQFLDPTSNFRLFIVPVDVGLSQPVRTCVMCEELVSENDERRYFVTNYCLKYSTEQFREARERDGVFTVTNERTTGDRSVTFQLARMRS